MDRTTHVSIVAFIAASVGPLGLARATIPSCSSNGYLTATAAGASAITPSADHCALNADNYFNHTTRTASDTATPGIDDGATAFTTLSNPSTTTFFPDVLVDLAGTDAHGHVFGLTPSRMETNAANKGLYWVGNANTAEKSADVAMFQSPSSGPAAGKLLLFFPGCGGSPENYTHFLQYAAHQGYHVIALSYFNPCSGQLSDPDFRLNVEGTWLPHVTMQETPYSCQDTPASENPAEKLASYGASSSQDDCIHQRFAGIVYGDAMSAPYSSTATMGYHWSCPAGSTAVTDPSDEFTSCQAAGKVVVPTTTGAEFGAANTPDWSMNSVEHRLHTVLSYLHTSFPLQNWESFCSDGACAPGGSWDVVWSQVALSGHSLGTNVASYIATVHDAARVMLFSGPASSIWDPNASCPANAGCNVNVGCSQEVPYGAPTMVGNLKVSAQNVYVLLSYFDTVAGFSSELAGAGVGVPQRWYGFAGCTANGLPENYQGISSGSGVGLGLWDDTYCSGASGNGWGCAECAPGSGCDNDVFNAGARPLNPGRLMTSEHLLIDTGSPQDATASNPYAGSGHNFVIADREDPTYDSGSSGSPTAFYGRVWDYMLTNCVGTASCR